MTKAYVLISSEIAYTKDVLEGLRKLEGLVEVHEVLGPYDIVAEVVAADSRVHTGYFAEGHPKHRRD